MEGGGPGVSHFKSVVSMDIAIETVIINQQERLSFKKSFGELKLHECLCMSE